MYKKQMSNIKKQNKIRNHLNTYTVCLFFKERKGLQENIIMDPCQYHIRMQAHIQNWENYNVHDDVLGYKWHLYGLFLCSLWLHHDPWKTETCQSDDCWLLSLLSHDVLKCWFLEIQRKNVAFVCMSVLSQPYLFGVYLGVRTSWWYSCMQKVEYSWANYIFCWNLRWK